MTGAGSCGLCGAPVPPLWPRVRVALAGHEGAAGVPICEACLDERAPVTAALVGLHRKAHVDDEARRLLDSDEREGGAIK